MAKQQRMSQQQVIEKNIFIDGLKAQVDELKASLVSKDNSYSTVSNTARKAEVEVEELRVRLEETKKSLDMWKTKGLGNQSGEYEMLRVCWTKQMKPNVVLILTYHRTSPSARYAGRTSRTQPSRLAATSSAGNVWKSACSHGCGNVRTVTRLLVRTITCELRFKRGAYQVLSFLSLL